MSSTSFPRQGPLSTSRVPFSRWRESTLLSRGRERILGTRLLCLLHHVPSKALSTIIRFQTKTELFCSVFKKICVYTYRFRIVFAPPHYHADQERSYIVGSIHHFGHSRSSGLIWHPVVSTRYDVTVFR